MTRNRISFVTIGLVHVLVAVTGSQSSDLFHKCGNDQLAIYNLSFETFWTKDEFPKQYPENRPPAQWSKLIGMTHNENYTLFRLGELANKDFKMFAETGKIHLFGMSEGPHIFDEFSASSIKTGNGSSKVHFFVDGNHSLVSLAAKIIPSPDWFVGVDSLPLCTAGNWLDSIVIEAGPMDAGTDSGYTFTAPNWETDPQEVVTRITSQNPKHPANSFYYPNLTNLPTIARFHLMKKKVYDSSKKAAGKINEIIARRKFHSHSTGEMTDDMGQSENGSHERNFKFGKPTKHKRFHYKRKLRKQWKSQKR